MQQSISTTAIVVAAGKGKRMGANYNKQFIQLREKPILAYTLEALHRNILINEIILVVGEAEVDFCLENIIDKYGLEKVTKVIAGGAERQDSVYRGLSEIGSEVDIVLVQDGARPFITDAMIKESIEVAAEAGAVIVAVPVKDTIKLVDENMQVVETLDRSRIVSVQTPQTFKRELLLAAYEELKKTKLQVTDDASVVEAMGIGVKSIMGSYDNIKITTPEDLIIAEEILTRGGK